MSALPPTTWHGRHVTVMGLGSFGGGVALARYLVTQGANVTVTDLHTADALQASLAALHDLPIRFVLGEHRDTDFVDTDVVFVNPAVPLTSPYLDLARTHGVPLDSEINLFVRQCSGRSPVRFSSGSGFADVSRPCRRAWPNGSPGVDTRSCPC